MKKISIVLIMFLLSVFAVFLYYKEGTLPTNAKNPTNKIFVIRKGENATQIAKNLENDNLIRNRIVFYFIVKRLGIENKIQAGDYRLSTAMDAEAIAKNLTKGTLDVWVTVIEGLRKEEVAQTLAKELGIPEIEIIKSTREGYLFPDTYLFPKNADIDIVLQTFQNNFEKKYQTALKNRTHDNGLTENEIITLASLVEKEARSEKHKKIVASIIFKRLKNDWPLQIDATVQYAVGYQTKEKTWWKRHLTKDDLAIDSVYNTYKNTGLPIEPIANPGLAAIEAAMNADGNTPYWYYISSADGSEMIYSETLDEHNANVQKYLR